MTEHVFEKKDAISEYYKLVHRLLLTDTEQIAYNQWQMFMRRRANNGQIRFNKA